MHNPILMLNVLRRDFPEIAVRISENIDSEMPPAILTDSDQIPWIIEDFSELRGIAYDNWNNQPGQSRITNERELLLAVTRGKKKYSHFDIETAKNYYNCRKDDQGKWIVDTKTNLTGKINQVYFVQERHDSYLVDKIIQRREMLR